MKLPKHPFSIIVSVFLCLSMLLPQETGAAWSFGDVNADTNINSSDAADILIESARIGSGEQGSFTSEQFSAADINHDGQINASDAADLLTYTAEIGAGTFSGTLSEYMQDDTPTPTETVPPTTTQPPTEPPTTQPPTTEPPTEPLPSIDKNGTYTSQEDVAAYIHTFGTLPSNYITKQEAQALGWDSKKGNLWDVAPGKSIGGDYFGNREKLLPDGTYHECDVNYAGGYRGAERLVYSTDRRVYYTADHYTTFTQLY